MKIHNFVFFLILCFFMQSCINHKQPVYEQPVYEDTSDIIHPDSEKTAITVYGYGYFRGKSKIAVQRFAIQKAKVSIAEQVRGSAFSIKATNNEISFSMDTGEVKLKGIRKVAEKIWQRNGEWEMYVIQTAEINVATPGGTEIIIQDVIGEDENIAFLLSALKIQAVKDTLLKEKESARKDKITGHIYLTSLEIEPLPDRKGISAQARFHIIVD